MKLNNILKYAVIAAAAVGTASGVTSCNYLDVVPPEQAGLDDAMKTHQTALGFLYSCYNGTTNTDTWPTEYMSGFCSSTDEIVLPPEQESQYTQIFANLKNTQTTDLSNISHLWGSMYRFIGQCLLFEQQLTTIGRENNVCENALEEQEWLAETRFLKAYYHYCLLRIYGPIPLTMERIDMDAPSSDFPGRSHFDYCVNYLANEFDMAAAELPATRENVYFGRATKVMAKAMKARVLMLAASDLYNGRFPYPEWKNTNYETPGYGYELISRTYDRSKWERAYNATREAIDLAEANGHSLMQTYEEEASVPLTSLDWLPVTFADDAEKLEFQKKVMLNRYIHTTSQSENPEILWSLRQVHSFAESGRLPLKIVKDANGMWYKNSYSVVNPTLNTVYNFLCKDGLLPAQSHNEIDFPSRNEWFQRAVGKSTAGHEDIINLMCNREPRFYAWIAFDGGEFLNRLSNGNPLILDYKSSTAQGRNQAEEPRNYASTGLGAMKHIYPGYSVASTFAITSGTQHPVVMLRLTELYLNLAECAAELAKTDDSYKQIALYNLNLIRSRAGVPSIPDDNGVINTTYTDPVSNTTRQMSLLEWVRQERFIELWDEGQRYYDVRRWVAGSQYFGGGRRLGLGGSIENASFEAFNQPYVLSPNYTFGTRQYLYPVFINEVYKNPQMVQAPGY